MGVCRVADSELPYFVTKGGMSMYKFAIIIKVFN